jgi:hypothetical protein
MHLDACRRWHGLAQRTFRSASDPVVASFFSTVTPTRAEICRIVSSSSTRRDV